MVHKACLNNPLPKQQFLTENNLPFHALLSAFKFLFHLLRKRVAHRIRYLATPDVNNVSYLVHGREVGLFLTSWTYAHM